MSEANEEDKFDCGSSPLLSGDQPCGRNPDYDGSPEAEIARLQSSRDRARRERDTLRKALETIAGSRIPPADSQAEYVHQRATYRLRSVAREALGIDDD